MKKSFTLLAIICYLAISQLNAQSNSDIVKEKYHEHKPTEDAVGYTHAVKVGKTLYISGTVAQGNIEQQITSIYESIKNL